MHLLLRKKTQDITNFPMKVYHRQDQALLRLCNLPFKKISELQ